MKQIGLVVDEGADLTKEIIERNQIEIVSFKLDWPAGNDLPGENIYQKMREADKRGLKNFAKTSQPSPKDFLEAYRKQLLKFEEIICITITSQHSGTYNSAIQAKNFLTEKEGEKISVVDSLNASGGEGLLVLRAIDLMSGIKKNREEIVKELEELRSKIYLRVMFKDPKWIEASGRMSHTLANWVRRMEKIGVRPMLGIKKGKVSAVGIRTGARDMPTALFKEFEEITKKLRKQNEKVRAIIVHSDYTDGAQKLKEMIENNLKNVEIVFINLINSIVGTIAGPDGLAFALALTGN